MSILFYHLALRFDWKHTRQYALYLYTFISLVVLFIIGFPYLLQIVSSNTIFQRFQKYGMYGTGRMGIWEEYLSVMISNLKNTILGVKFSDLSLMVRYKNNLHNSIFNLHALYGLLFVSFVCLLFIKNAVKCVLKKKWLYLFVLLVFFLRSMTDRFYGGGLVGTPVLFFILFYIDKPMPDAPNIVFQETNKNAKCE